MIVIIDGDYKEDNSGFIAGVLMEDFNSKEICGFITAEVFDVGEYQSGSFYKRELKGVDAVLTKLNLSQIQCIIVDGYAKFEDGEHTSLGEWVYKNYAIPVIGIAKSKNLFSKVENTQVYRGNSKTPLYVTAVGIDQDIARGKVQSMYGENRIPYGVKIADSVARKHKIILN